VGAGVDPSRIYHLAIRNLQSGRRFPLGEADDGALTAARAQVEFLALRRNVVPADWSGLTIREEPLYRDGSTGLLAGVRIIARGATGEASRDFTASQLFSNFLTAKLEQLTKSKTITAEDKITIELTAIERPSTTSASNERLGDFTVSRLSLPLAGSISQLALNATTPCGTAGDDYPLIVPQRLATKARQLCEHSRGAEGGAMLLGNLFRLEGDQPDIVGVVHAVLELRHATQTKFGFQPTTQTFVDLAAQQSLRRNRLNFSTEVPLVLLHTHPFEPSVRDDGEANCTTCPLQKTCQLTSSFYSASDVEFHLGMYGTTPWTVGMVLGMTPRREEDLRMFCLEGNSIRERGFYWSE
jgi:hypothetical protein